LNTTHKALGILNFIVDAGLQDVTTILVPNVNNQLQPRDKIFFNNLGPRSSLIALPDGHSLAHQDLVYSIAKRLGIPALSLSELKPFDEDDEDMGELLTTRIHNVLRQYTVEQAYGELLSNAADARAEMFNILIDTKSFGSSNVLLPTLAEFQTLPALIFHNDATFTDDDFKGIRRIGRGGKEGRTDTIGQFGLGALSVYHFTEVRIS
jgi:hypothetical protein